MLKLSLRELVTFLSVCDLFIGHSTGPLHIAAAVGIPTIGLFGLKYYRSTWQRWHPVGKYVDWLYHDPGCKECYPWACKTRACINNITAEEVLGRVKRLLKVT